MLYQHYMRLALDQAKLACQKGEIPIGAVMVCDGQVIAQAHNLRETEHDPTAHAEVLVIREAAQKLGGWRLKQATLYVTVEPCPMCAGAIVMARIPKLVFGALDVKAGGVESIFNITNHPLLNHQVEVIGGILEAECSEILRDFFDSLRTKED